MRVCSTSLQSIPALALSLSVILLTSNPVLAAGGLDKINTFMDNVLQILRGVSIAVVTIAIMWAGYKYLFQKADLAECGKILAGGLLIGGAAEIARYLLS